MALVVRQDRCDALPCARADAHLIKDHVVRNSSTREPAVAYSGPTERRLLDPEFPRFALVR
jgi:hypothetical protein